VPVVESLGWTVNDVAIRSGSILGPAYGTHKPWFLFPARAAPDGIWFDATVQRTERYGLYTIPFLKDRLRRLWMFSSREELTEALIPFAQAQEAKKAKHPNGMGFAEDSEGKRDDDSA